MLDIQLLRSDIDFVKRRLEDRGSRFPAGEFLELEANRKKIQTRTQELQARRNTTSTQVGQFKAVGDLAKVEELKQGAVADAGELKNLEKELAEIQARLETFLLDIPNVPHDSVPTGKSSAEIAKSAVSARPASSISLPGITSISVSH